MCSSELCSADPFIQCYSLTEKCMSVANILFAWRIFASLFYKVFIGTYIHVIYLHKDDLVLHR